MTGAGRTVGRLKKRRDFLAVAQGRKIARRSFVLESGPGGDADATRFGFTVSKRTAKKAVERNRIRRRLKEAARLAAIDARCGVDYVLIGRRDALVQSFVGLQADLAGALQEAPRRSPRGGRGVRSESR